jgi:hypothetical protein
MTQEHGFGPYNYGPSGYGYGPGPYGRGYGPYGGYATGPYGHHWGPRGQGWGPSPNMFGPEGLGYLRPPGAHPAAVRALRDMSLMLVGVAGMALMFGVAMQRVSGPCKGEMVSALRTVSSQDMFDMLVHQHLLTPEQAKQIVDAHVLSSQPIVGPHVAAAMPGAPPHPAAAAAAAHAAGAQFGYEPYGYGPPGYGRAIWQHEQVPIWLRNPYAHGSGLLRAPAASAAHQLTFAGDEKLLMVLFGVAMLGLMIMTALTRVSPGCRTEVAHAMGTVSTQDIFDALMREHMLTPEQAKQVVDAHVLSTQAIMPTPVSQQLAAMSAGYATGAAPPWLWPAIAGFVFGNLACNVFQLVRVGQAPPGHDHEMGEQCCDMRTHKHWPLDHPQPRGSSCHHFMHGHGIVC